MSEVLGNNSSESNNSSLSNQWESVSEQKYNPETLVLAEQSETPETIEHQQTREESIEAAKEKVMSAFSTRESAKEHENGVEMAEFLGMRIPRHLLGEEKITLGSIEPRTNDGLFGVTKKRDQKKLNRLLTNAPSKQLIEKELTPQVAFDYLEAYKARGGFRISPQEASIIESLPLSEQEKIFNTKSSNAADYIWESPFSTSSPSFMMKTLIGASKTLLEQPSVTLSDIQFIEASAEQLLEKEPTDNKIGIELFDMIVGALEGNSGMRKEGKSSILSKSKIYLGTRLLPKEYFREHFDAIVDKDYMESDEFSLLEAYEISKALKDGSETERKKLELLPTHLRQFAEEHGNLLKTGRFGRNMNDEQMKEVIDLVNQCNDVVHDKNLLYIAALSKKDDYLSVMKMMTESDVDESLLENIHKYLKRALSLDAGTQFEMPVESLEDLRNYQAFYEKNLQREIEKSIESDPDRVRELISLYLYGQTTGRIGQDLTALGIVEVAFLNRKDFSPGDGYNAKMKQRIHLNHKKFQEIQSSNGITDAQKCLILDALDLVCCKNEDLLDRFNRLKGKTPEETELGDILNKMREVKMKEVSRNYSDYMKKTIEQNSQLIGETTYDDKKIPVLKMVGDGDFMILTHHLGAYSGKKNNLPPQEWNEREADQHDNSGNPVGYISTCAITPGCMKMAATPEEIKSPDEIYYGFTDFGEKTILFTSEHDLYTEDEMSVKGGGYKTTIDRQDFIDSNPRTIIERTRKASLLNSSFHNEVVLDRYSGNPEKQNGRLQPNYIITFLDNPSRISETVKRQAAYFGIPILMINYDKYKQWWR